MNKLAAHPHDRLQERAPNLPANTVEAVQDIARGLQGKFRGDGYFPLHNNGTLQGYAAIRTVGKHHVPVVTTILAPHMHASGINLQKVLESQQQKIADKTLREAFEEKIKEKDGKDIWTGSVNSDGYPNMRDGEKYELASHVALKLNGRTPPNDGGKTVVMHLDNNPRNLTPSNLRVGSQKRNLQQSEDEGRWVPRGPNKEASALAQVAIPGALVGGLTMLMALGAVGPQGRKRMNSEVHDPRLYSNLRGIFESAEDRVKAHKDLDRRKDHSVLSAMHEGFTRGSSHDKKASDEYSVSRWVDKGSPPHEQDLNRIDIHHGGKNVAFLSYHPGSDGDYTWLKGMHVEPEHRGRGLAHRLMEEVIKDHPDRELRLRAKPFRDSPVSAGTLKSFYGQHGFVPIDDEDRMSRAPNKKKEASIGKLALTRMVKEWRAADASGNSTYADQLAETSGQLGLRPRELRQQSVGGQEAAATLTMGSAAHNAGAQEQYRMADGRVIGSTGAREQSQPNFQERFRQYKMNGGRPAPSAPATPTPAPNESGYVLRKDYKPDSVVSRGTDTTALMDDKMRMTKNMRDVSPEARNMVPDMYGHTTRTGPGGAMGHSSYHEYVKGLAPIPQDQKVEATNNLQNKVVKPVVAAHGTEVGDVPYTMPMGQGVHVGGNGGNLMQSPTGHKLVDFIPTGEGASTPMWKTHESNPSAGHDMVAARYLSPGETAYNTPTTVKNLSQDAFRPGTRTTWQTEPPNNADGKPMTRKQVKGWKAQQAALPRGGGPDLGITPAPPTPPPVAPQRMLRPAAEGTAAAPRPAMLGGGHFNMPAPPPKPMFRTAAAPVRPLGLSHLVL